MHCAIGSASQNYGLPVLITVAENDYYKHTSKHNDDNKVSFVLMHREYDIRTKTGLSMECFDEHEKRVSRPLQRDKKAPSSSEEECGIIDAEDNNY